MLNIMERKLLFITLLFFSSCYFNATLTNEESEKEKGILIAEKLYDYIESKEFDNSIKPYLSIGMLQNNSMEILNQTFENIQSENGSFVSKELTKWSTERGKNEDKLIWECTLHYKVNYEKSVLNETLYLIKENDSIKIHYYKLRRQ